MVKLIPGKKGSGKTKVLIAAIHEAQSKSNGNVVAVQIGKALNEDIDHRVRLVDIEDYKVKTYESFYGFIAGVLASDYDCTDIFVDGILRIVGRDYDKVGKVLDEIAGISGDSTITLTISADASELPASLNKYN